MGLYTVVILFSYILHIYVVGCLYSTVGVHPTYCQKFLEAEEGPDTYLEQLITLASTNKDKVVCVGEMGLGKFSMVAGYLIHLGCSSIVVLSTHSHDPY